MTRRLTLAATLALAAALVLPSAAGAAPAKKLTGTFKFGKGTYFRMVYPNGSVEKGPFFANPNSRSKDKTYTVLKAGIDGGLRTGVFQEAPDPPFDSRGFSLSNRIMQPTLFAGIAFGLSTAAEDAQSGKSVGAPVVKLEGRKLSGDLRAFTASWNSIWFNQGSPKPNGRRPGLTRAVSGTYNPKTKRYLLTWTSQIVGGPFNDFTGYWHLQGKFKPAR